MATQPLNGHARDTITLRRYGPGHGWPQQDTPGHDTAAQDDAGQAAAAVDNGERPRQQDDAGQAAAGVDTPGRDAGRRYPWPLVIIAAPAAVAVWSGWVGLGAMCGFGVVDLLPGIADLRVNTAITLPVGIESYGAYALAAWIGGKGSARTRTFAFRSAIGALALGCLGQVAFHLLAAAGWTVAPWPVVMAVACLPVVTLSFAAALVHLKRADAMAGPVEDGAETVQAAGVDMGVDTVSTPPPAWQSMPPGGEKAAAIIKAEPGLTNAEVAELAGVRPRTVTRVRNPKDRSTT